MAYDYGRLGERPRGTRFPVLEILSALLLGAAIVLAMVELVRYSNSKDALPTDLMIAGVQVGGLSEADAQARLDAIYINQPVRLSYDGSPILLDPTEIGFRINSEVMLAEARAQSSGERNFWTGFWKYLGREPVSAVSVPLNANYDPGVLRAYLEGIAARYDAPPGTAAYDPASLTFSTGESGREMDIDAAMPLIDAALRSPFPQDRVVDLPTAAAGASQRSMETLRAAIIDMLARRQFPYNGPDSVVSVYVMDLKTGEEMSIQGDLVHSAFSVIKIPIMVNYFRTKLTAPSQEEAYLLTESILCSNNASSNWLIQLAGLNSGAAGQGESAQMAAGLNGVSCTAQSLGAKHTFLSAPLWIGTPQAEAPVCRPETPGNTDLYTSPDRQSQTTAEDMGMLLTEIYDCAYNGGGLRVLLPDDITQTECEQMLNLLSANRIDRLIELGVPTGTRVAHKNGWGTTYDAFGTPDGAAASDAAIVFGPSGDYVLVVLTWERDTDGDGRGTLAAWEAVEEVSRVVWNYFNPEVPLRSRRDPISAFGAIHCVTVHPDHIDLVNLNDINAGRLDEFGNPAPTACYGGRSELKADGTCLPFNGWNE